MTTSERRGYSEYVLTEKGRRLHLVVAALRQWGEDELYGPEEDHSVLADVRDGLEVARLTLRAADGRILLWDETRVQKVGSTSFASQRGKRHRPV